MAFKTFAPGVLTSSDLNTFLMRQSVISCTSSTRPVSPNEGMTIYETDTSLYRVYSGTAWEVLSAYGAWTAFTPVLTNWTLGNATHDCRFMRVGRLVVAEYNITWGSTSVFSGGLDLSYPIPALPIFGINLRQPQGWVRGYDLSIVTPYPGQASRLDSNRWAPGSFNVAATHATLDSWNATTPTTWVSGDTFQAEIIYEAGS